MGGALAALVIAGVACGAGSDEGPSTVHGYREMCKKPRAFSKAAPYARSGPRPVFVSDFWPTRDSYPDPLGTVDRGTWAPEKPGKVQLVACVDHIGQGEYLTTCDYRGLQGSGIGGTGGDEGFVVYYYKGKYKVTVYEARTGKRRGSTTVQGDIINPSYDRPRECPGMAAQPKRSSDNEREGDPSTDQLYEALAPFVTGRAGAGSGS
ncbi:hypothetical protein [Streptomyces sp. NPDC058045]|uniref:hypothetical protein n=1 Tax=Streptomyces sp. NPDC058045 TaxID=3346311 RepID=UPI0036ED49ED